MIAVLLSISSVLISGVDQISLEGRVLSKQGAKFKLSILIRSSAENGVWVDTSLSPRISVEVLDANGGKLEYDGKGRSPLAPGLASAILLYPGEFIGFERTVIVSKRDLGRALSIVLTYAYPKHLKFEGHSVWGGVVKGQVFW